MKQRLEQFLACENLSKSQFADKINVARAGITHIMAGRNNPSYEFIVNTMTAFPDLNIEWLLTGNGRMYKTGGLFDQTENTGSFENTHINSPAVNASAEEPIEHIATSAIKSKQGIRRIVVFFEDGTFQDFC